VAREGKGVTWSLFLSSLLFLVAAFLPTLHATTTGAAANAYGVKVRELTQAQAAITVHVQLGVARRHSVVIVPQPEHSQCRVQLALGEGACRIVRWKGEEAEGEEAVAVDSDKGEEEAEVSTAREAE
jgi:hypothetical protein